MGRNSCWGKIILVEEINYVENKKAQAATCAQLKCTL